MSILALAVLAMAPPTDISGVVVNTPQVVADCLVAPDGTLGDCRIGSERPDGFGFGEAAVLVAGQVRLNLWSLDGRPTAGYRIRLPVDFNEAP